MRRSSRTRQILPLLSTALAALVIGCSPEPTASLANKELRISASNSSATTDMSVSATTPDSASQDTTLDVTISGSGFVSGTAATWALSGVADPSQVKTNRTTYVSSRKIIANITISATASAAKWDVVLTAAGKKGGIGSEAFAIKAKPAPLPRALIVFEDVVNVATPGAPQNWQPAGIKGDGRLRDGSTATSQPSNEYLGNLCGVSANIENGPRMGGDLDFDPNLNYSTTACGAARYYNFYLNGSTAQPTALTPLSRVFNIWAMVVGQSAMKGQGFGVQLPNCSVLSFDSQYGGDNLLVTRVDDGSGPRKWVVSSQGQHMAACTVPGHKAGTSVATGVKYYLPFSYTAIEVP